MAATTTFLGTTTQLAASYSTQLALGNLKASPSSGSAPNNNRGFVCRALADAEATSRREALTMAAAAMAAGIFSLSGKANASLTEDLLAKSAANKALNDKKRSLTSYANLARAYTVQNGTCAFPDNFTGCQDLAKRKAVPFLSDDLALECEGTEKGKCGSNNFK
eukprot:TRINITY_DN276_c0_g1_i2.p1 TRINITY_DN276_c0_g1~~TRINITY_DN276_c0_g1_i2.p1  ORF type:complete len:164 (-),score=30.93 TRINITY_DN276_c0_g1_i2:941-1432(-)